MFINLTQWSRYCYYGHIGNGADNKKRKMKMKVFSNTNEEEATETTELCTRCNFTRLDNDGVCKWCAKYRPDGWQPTNCNKCSRRLNEDGSPCWCEKQHQRCDHFGATCVAIDHNEPFEHDPQGYD